MGSRAERNAMRDVQAADAGKQRAPEWECMQCSKRNFLSRWSCRDCKSKWTGQEQVFNMKSGSGGGSSWWDYDTRDEPSVTSPAGSADAPAPPYAMDKQTTPAATAVLEGSVRSPTWFGPQEETAAFRVQPPTESELAAAKEAVEAARRAGLAPSLLKAMEEELEMRAKAAEAARPLSRKLMLATSRMEHAKAASDALQRRLARTQAAATLAWTEKMQAEEDLTRVRKEQEGGAAGHTGGDPAQEPSSPTEEALLSLVSAAEGGGLSVDKVTTIGKAMRLAKDTLAARTARKRQQEAEDHTTDQPGKKLKTLEAPTAADVQKLAEQVKTAMVAAESSE